MEGGEANKYKMIASVSNFQVFRNMMNAAAYHCPYQLEVLR